MKTFPSLLLFFLVFVAIINAADATDAPVRSPNADWNEKTDYTALRMKCASAPDYNAYAYQVVEKMLIKNAMEEWDKKDGNAAKALGMLMDAAKSCPLSIEINRRIADGCAVLSGSIKNPEDKKALQEIETHYRTISEGLLKSIVASGDGKSPKTAYKVISIPEEYMTLWYLGLEPEGQSVGKSDGVTCDILSVKDRKTGKKSDVYFDITLFYDKSEPDAQKSKTTP